MVRLVKIQSIHEYIKKNPRAKNSLEAWADIVTSCTWEKPQDIVATFGSKAVDILGKKDKKPETRAPDRAIIDIAGNNLRIIVKYQFHPRQKMTWLFIKWIGTHAEYDRVCASNNQYTIEMF